MRLKIATWNVHRCIGTDGHYDPDRIARVLTSIDADIVALQEVDSSLRAKGEIDQLTYLAQATKMSWVLGGTLARDYGTYGNAILHRVPLKSCENLNLSFRKYEPRGAMAATFEIEGKSLRLINTHLGLKHWERAFQLQALFKDFIERDDDFTCLIGDLNEWFPFSPNAFRTARAFAPSKRLATFPSPWPRLALDRILFKEIVPQSIAVATHPEARLASDHLPLVASIDV